MRTDCEISTPTFLKSGKKTLSNLNVDHIKIASLTQVGATNNWNGRLEVKFSGSNIQLKDLSMPINVESSGPGPFQVDTCSVVDNLDQTASCKSLGGTLENGKCIIQDPQANCQSLGGTYDTTARKCKLNSLPTTEADCVSTYGAGWTFNGTACVPPATSPKGTIAGHCGTGTQLITRHPAYRHPQRQTCECETGWSLILLSSDISSLYCPLGNYCAINIYACIKN